MKLTIEAPPEGGVKVLREDLSLIEELGILELYRLEVQSRAMIGIEQTRINNEQQKSEAMRKDIQEMMGRLEDGRVKND